MSKKNTTELAKSGEPAKNKENSLIESNLSSMIEEYAAENDYRKDFDSEDLITPRLRILQSGSPQVKKQRPEYIAGAEAGMIYNTASRNVTEGGEGLLVVPCAFNKEFVEWIPQSAGGGLVKRWGDDDSFKSSTREDKGKWINDQTGTETVRTANYYVLIVDKNTGFCTPAIITLGGTEYKKSKGWATLISACDYMKQDGSFITPPPFYKAYRITTIPESNDKGDWFGFRITFECNISEIPNSGSIWNTAKEFRSMIQEGKVKLQAEQEDTARDSETI